MGFTKTTRALSILCLGILSLLALTGDESKKGPGSRSLPFDVHQVIEKATHLIKQDPQDPNKYVVKSSSYQGEFDPEAFIYKAKNHDDSNQNAPDQQEQALRFSLSAIRLGQENLVGRDKKVDPPTVQENQVIYHRAEGIREIYEAKRAGVEQSWEIQKLPPFINEEGHDLIIEGRISTHLVPKPNRQGGIDFFDQDGSYVVSYSQATVIDAKGKRLEIPSVLQKKEELPSSHLVSLSLPQTWLAQATFPIIIDPLIGSTNITINADAGAQARPALAYSGTNFLVVWQDGTPANEIGGSGASALADIKGQLVNPDGSLSGTVISVDVTTGTDQTYPAVAYIGGSCGYFVAYQNYIDATNLNDIYGRCVTTTGTTPNPTFAVASGTSEELFPTVALNSSTSIDLLVAFGAGASGVAGGAPVSVLGQQVTCNPTCVNGANTVTIGPVTVAGGLVAPYVVPSIAFGSSNFVVVWEDFAADTAGNIVANTVSGTWVAGTPFSVAATTAPERFPSVAYGGADFLAVWQNGSTGGAADIYGQRIQVSPSIGVIGSQLFVSTAFQDQRYPRVSFNGTNYLAVWQDYRNSITNPDIYATGVTPAGGVVDSNGFPVYQGAVASTSVFKQNPFVMAGGSNFLAAWSDNRNNTGSDCITTPSNCDLFGQFFGPPVVTSLSPSTAEIGQSVSINGTNFGSDPGAGNRSTASNHITLNGVQIPDSNIASWSNTLVTFNVPTGSTSGPIVVRAQNWDSNNDQTLTVTVPSLSINDVTVTEGNTGTVNAVFTVSLSAASGQTVTVDYATADGTAVAPGDYTAGSGTLTFAAGTTTQTVAVVVNGDTTNEANETFTVNLTNPTNATILDGQGQGTINNDDPEPTVAFSVASSSGLESVSPANLAVVLSTVSGQTVSVSYAVSGGTATGGGTDYALSAGTLTFAPGVTTQNIPITVVDDALDEADETIQVTLSNPVNATLGVFTSHTYTIADNDPTPALSINDVTVTEGNSGTTNAVFTVTLSAASGQTVTVDYATADGTAVAPGDYAAASGTLTFAAGTTTQTVAVVVNGDTTNEANETFTVNLTNPTNATITDGQGIGTINNDDPVPTLLINDITVTEGNSGTTNAVFTVTLSAASGQTVTVDYATADGTAVAPGDYAAASGTLTFAAGTTTQTVAVVVNGDTLNEVNETFTVTLTTPTNASLLDGVGVGTINDDDPVPSLSINDVTVTEGNSGTVNAVFTVTLSAASGQTVTVNYATADGTAVAPGDYAAASGTLTFAAGTTTQTVTVVVNGDTTNEANETFSVTLTASSNATIADGVGVGTINNDDGVPTLSIDDVTVTEGNTGTVNAIFTVTLSAASGQTVSVDYATANGSATAPSDYTAASGTLTFAAGTTTQTVTVVVNGDTTNEANETFTVNLSNAINATILDSQGIGTITNDDPVPTLSINDVTVTEGNTGTVNAVFTVTLSAASGQTVSVNYTTADGSAVAPGDYTAASGTVIFVPGSISQTIAVVVNGDTLNEVNETFTVNLTNPTNATITDAQGVGTINNDDPVPTLSINDITVTEGNSGTVNAVFTVTLSAASGQTVTVDYATANGTAVAPGDYAAASGTLTFAAGTTTQTVTVVVNGDTTNEANETFTVNLTNPTNATILDGQGIGTITNDDGVPTLSIDDVTVTEGNTGTVNAIFTVTLSAASGQTVSVDYATANGSATAPSDYTAASGTLTFAAGTTTQTVTVVVNGDTTNEANETFTVNLTNPTNATILDGQGVGTITNDDAVPSLSINDVTVTEGNTGTVNAVFTVSLSAASGQTVSVNYTTADGSAVAPGDYTAASGTVTFVPGAISQTIAVVVNGDTTNEANETFTVNLSNATNATILDGQGVGSITNDDAVPTLSIDDVTVTEGNTGTVNAIFTVTLSAASGQTVTVDYATADGTATVPSDYTAASGTLTFAAGTTTQTVTVVVNGDTTNEANETFTVNLTNPTNAIILDGQGIGTITNDDGVVTLSIDDVTVTEGNTGTTNAVFTVTLSAASGQTVSVDYATANGSATAPSDYTAASGTLTFAAGTTTQTVTVVVNGDTTNEANETFTVNLSNATNATILDGQGVGTIANDDAVPSLSINDVTVTEGNSGTVNAIFTVSLSAASGQTVSVNYTTADGSAVAPGDYTAASGTVTFVPGSISQTIAVVVNGDTTNEANETFVVNLSNATNATIADGQGVGTIANDDAVPSLSINDVTVTEGNSGTVNAIFTVSLSVASGQTVTVDYATADGTAVAPGDYTAASGTLTFASGTTAQTVAVVVNGDTLNEINETFSVTLTNPTNATILDAVGIGTINNDDAIPTLSINDVTVTEGNTGTVNAVFTVSLSAASGQTVTVDYATADGTAVAPGDYAAASGTLTFAAGTTTQTVAVVVNGDALNEINETFVVNLANSTNATILDGQGVGTIANDDAVPSLSINDVTVTEGNTGTVNAVFTVSLSAASGQTVTVDYATANGTAVAPGDYTAASGTLTFAAGTTTQTVTVVVNGDTTNEANETFTVNLTNPTNATITDGQGIGTINNDDPMPSVAFTVSAQSGLESVGSMTATVQLSTVSGQDVTVPYTVSGTAGNPGDYTITASPVVIPAGSSSATITITVVDDLVDEVNETVEVTLSNPVNATLGTPSVHTFTIQDNDGPAVSFNLSSSSGSESVSPANLTVSLSAASPQTVTVDYAVTGASSATGGGVDYTLVAGTLTFAPGVTSQSIPITIVDDLVDEVNETIQVALSNPVNATLGSITSHTYTILDNDGPAVAFDFTSSSGSESVSPANLTVSLSAASPQTVTVDYAVTGGTATGDGVDYTLAAGTLTFPPGVGTQSITITIINDILTEANETIVVTLFNPVNANLGTTITHTYTILDNDPPTTLVMVSGNGQTGTVNQPLAAPFVVRVDNASGAPVSGYTVVFNVTGGGGSLVPDTDANPAQETVLTNAQGEASVMLTLGTVAGTNNNTVTATATGLTGSPMLFTASAVAGALHHYAVTTTTPQVAGVGWTETVRAEDAFNNLITTNTSTVVLSGTGSLQFYTDSTYTVVSNTSTLNNGTAALYLRDTVAETVSFTVTRQGGTETGTSGSIVINPGTPSGTINLIANPSSIVADGNSTSTVSSAPIRDSFGNIVLNGTLITVSTSLGVITTSDVDPNRAGLQVTTAGGVITFVVRSATTVGTATVTATSVEGTASGSTTITFVPGVPAGNIALTTSPSNIVADGVSTSTVTSGIIRDANNNTVSDGTLITVATNLGTITTLDADAGTPGTQVATVSGVITFTVQSSTMVGTATVTATSVLGSATGSTTINFYAPVIITTTSLSGATQGAVYSQTLTATGGLPPLTWSIVTGALPDGVSLNSSNGVISGTPTLVGTFNFTARATDTNGVFDDQALTIVVNPPPTVVTTTLPQATVTGAYSQTLLASGGTLPLSWSLVAGALPTGLNLSTGGVISGTPTTSGTYNFTVRVTDANGVFDDQALTFIVNQPPIITTTTLPPGTVGATYSQTLTASDGTLPLSWSVASGTLPTGLSLSTGGVISGTSTVAGTFNFTVQVTDANQVSDTQPLTIVVNAPPVVTTTSLPDATVTAAYNQTLSASGGTAPLTWSLAPGSGPLPNGLSLNGTTGVISGTPTVTGTFSLTVRVTDANLVFDDQDLTMVVNPMPVITTTSVPEATQNAGYNAPITVTGGTLPFSWSLAPLSGPLPNGLTFAGTTTTRNNAITGTPLQAGTFSFTLRVTDAYGIFVDQALTIVVNPPPVITTTSLNEATEGMAYSQTLSMTGGTLPVAWSLAAGALPPGLNLNASTGTVSGTPTQSGSYTFIVRVTDFYGVSDDQVLTLIVNAPPDITTTSLPDGTVSGSYSQTLGVTGGTRPLTWSLTAGALPNGLSLNSSTGVISGVPTQANTFNFTVMVTDTYGATDSQALSIRVNPAPNIITTVLPDATVGANYTGTLTVIGGTSPLTWGVVSGILPPGLSLNTATGIVTGIPNTVGVYNFTMRVADANGVFDDQPLSLAVAAAPVITTTALPGATVGGVYSQTLQLTGGASPYTWSLVTGTLPGGLSLDTAAGIISGTPTLAGSYSFTVRVTDANGAFDEQALTLQVNDPPVILTTALPQATVTAPYSRTPTILGGTAPFAWSLVSGSLPAGIFLNPTTGQISGTPVTVGTSVFIIRVTDANNVFDDQELTLVVNPLPTITTTGLPAATVGAAYSATLSATGGTPSLSWSVSGGALPPGLNLNSSTGAISGTPTAAGTYGFTVTVTDANGVSDAALFSMTVNGPPVIITTVLPEGTVNSSYTAVLSVSGGTPPFTWLLVSGALPPGIILNSATGTLLGTPTASDVYSFTVQVTDVNGAADGQALSLTIRPFPPILLNVTDVANDYGGEVQLTWAASEDPNTTAYNIYRSRTAGGPYTLITTINSATTYTDTCLANNTTYHYVITSISTTVNGQFESGYSNELSVVSLNNLSFADLTLNGINPSDLSGSSVSNQGDLDGDGLADLVIGAVGASPNGRTAAGEVYIILSRACQGGILNLNDPSVVRIMGAASLDLLGASIASGGDLNGDGLADLVIGAPNADPGGRGNAGSLYIFFGRAIWPNVIDLAVDTPDVRINGAIAGDEVGYYLSNLGDVNGDGVKDLVIGAPSVNGQGLFDSGAAYIIFGRSAANPFPSTIELSTSANVTLLGGESQALAGRVASAGDVNNDGFADILIGAPGVNGPAGSNTGATYLVLGRATSIWPSTLLLPQNSNMVIYGTAPEDQSGVAVSNGGDVNHDGYDDILIGAALASPGGKQFAGSSYLIFGGAAFPRTMNLSQAHVTFEGIAAGNQSGRALEIGNVNGDAFADIIIGAFNASPQGRQSAGQVYVIHGSTILSQSSTINLGSVGLTFDGESALDHFGLALSSRGDLNGDGTAEIFVGANQADSGSITDAGKSYVMTSPSSAPGDVTPPSPPTNLQASAGATQVALIWIAPPDPDVAGYHIYRNGVLVGSALATSFTDTGLTSGTAYSYTVSAVDFAGNESAQSTAVGVTTLADTTPPTQPANLTLTVLCPPGTPDYEILLTWTASTDAEGISGYKIYRNSDVEPIAVIGNFTSYYDRGLFPNTLYNYRVSAVDFSGNESSPSSRVSARTCPDPNPPTQPTNLTAAPASTTQINLAWSPSFDDDRVVRYNIYRNGVFRGSSGTTTYSDTGLISGTTYTYEVSAVDFSGNESIRSAPSSATTFVTGLPPGDPSSLSATAVSETQINLGWNPSSGGVGPLEYRIERSLDGSNFTQIGTSSTNTYSNTGLRAGTRYYYRVRAYDSATGLLSNYSNIANALTLDTSPPTTPTNFSATAVSESTIILMWTASTDNAGVAGYRIERSLDGTTFTQVTTSTVNLYVDSGLSVGTTYYYRIRAVDAAGNLSAYTAVVNATTLDVTPPTAPTGLSATAVSETQINLSWTASSDNAGVSGYRIERSLDGTNFVEVASIPNTPTSYSDTGLSAGTRYYYRIRAFDATGNLSNYSATASALTLDLTPPSVPTNLSANAVGSSTIVLIWTASTDNAGVAGYRIERSVDGVNFAQIASFTVNLYVDSGLSLGQTYYYRVRAFDAANNLSGYSNAANATTVDVSPPSVPGNLTATAVSETGIDLSWSASTDDVGVAGYRIERSLNGSSFTEIAQTTTATSYSDSGLTPGTLYYYRVRSYDAAGNISAYSSIVSTSTFSSLTISTSTGSVTLSSNRGEVVTASEVNASSLPPNPGVTFPYGVLSFTVDSLIAGQTATITLTLPGPVSTSAQYWKYGKEPGNLVDHWYTVPFGSNDGDNIITLTITDGGLGDNDLTANGIIIDPGGVGAPNLVITSASQTVTAGAVSGPVTIQVQDRFGSVVTGFNGTATLSSNSTTMRFDTTSTGSFSGSVTSITISNGQGSFYFKDTTAGVPTITVSTSGLIPATQTETITPAAASRLVITSAPQTVAVGAVSAPVMVEARDAFNNLATGFNGIVNLSSTSTTMRFDVSSTGLFDGTVTSMILSGGQGSFYFKDTTAGTPTITVSSTGLTSANQTETIQ